MNQRRIVIALAGLVVCLGAGDAWYEMRKERQLDDPRLVLSRFPDANAAVLSADFAVLRRAGLLGASKAAPEPEYLKFVEGTGFDYRRDLNSVTAEFSASGNYFIARGRFDWQKLRAYVAQQGGSCYQDLCRALGSTPERRISFLPLREDTIALAVSTDDLAATRLTKAGPAMTGELPAGPVWLSVPGAELAQSHTLPASLERVIPALRSAERVIFTVGASGNGIDARMEAVCRNPVDAGVLASQLRLATSSLREGLNAEQKSDALAAALVAGTFEQVGSRVTGRWPAPKTLLDSLTAGI